MSNELHGAETRRCRVTESEPHQLYQAGLPRRLRQPHGFNHHRHQQMLTRVRDREEQVLLAKIYHADSIDDVLSEI